MENLSQDEIQKLKQEGYSDYEIADALRDINIEEQQQGNQQRYMNPQAFSVNSAFAPQAQENLIKWQLELDNILERIEHILRSDILEFEMGHLVWKKNENPSDSILNNYGVAEIMRVLSMYLNRNTILSDYEPEEINYKLLDFGYSINNLLFMKYEEMGLDVGFEKAFQMLYRTNDKIMFSDEGIQAIIYSGKGLQQFQFLSPQQISETTLYRNHLALEKRKNYEMLIREIVDTVHSAYKRALHGGEKRSLREARTINQTESIQGQGGITINAGGGGNSRERSIFNPMRYLSSKVK